MTVTHSANAHRSIPCHPALAYRIDETGEVVVLPKLTTELPGGFTGYYQRTFDDCLRCAVATCLQVPYEELDISEQSPRETVQGPLLRFCKENRLELRGVDRDDPPNGPYLAISHPLMPDPIVHTFCRMGSDVFFNPWNFRRLDGSLYGAAGGDRMAYGYSLHRKDP